MYSFLAYQKACPPASLNRIEGWFRRVATALEARKEARQRAEVLAKLDPKMLCDIGADDVVQAPDARSLTARHPRVPSVGLMMLRSQ